jgi:hypothetical protein
MRPGHILVVKKEKKSSKITATLGACGLCRRMLFFSSLGREPG